MEKEETTVYKHFRLVIDSTTGVSIEYFDGFDIETPYAIAQDAAANANGSLVSLWEWTATAEPPRWIEIPIEEEN